MALAILQECMDQSKHQWLWLDLRKHIKAIRSKPDPKTFRRTWLEHAMRTAGATKKYGQPCPRKWARMLLPESKQNLLGTNAKAIEVHGWQKGTIPSVKNIQNSWRVVVTAMHLSPKDAENGADTWLFSWMITLLMEKHFNEITAALPGDPSKVKRYYSRFFQYLKLDLTIPGSGKEAGGHSARQP
jgi:hypothetical protein